MLIIRKEQWDVLSNSMLRSFEDETLKHVRKFFPQICQHHDDMTLRRRIRKHTKHAASYGIDGQSDICKFIDVIFALDPDFDTKLPWVQDILKDQTQPDVRDRVERLCRATIEYLQKRGNF